MLALSLPLFFILGYLAIIFEKFIEINKAAIALVMGVVCWALYFYISDTPSLPVEQLASIAQIIFFLLAAMVIVEMIDSHHGFKIITDLLTTNSQRKMLWCLLGVSFFMSAILDNLTSMIVMISLIRKLVPTREERWLFGSLVVIAVNAGGAWTPIGDVTTTMLWINDKISTWETIKILFLPSVANILVAGLLASFLVKGKRSTVKSEELALSMQPGAKWVLFFGVAALVMIPVWKALLGLPPFMGALIGLGILWLFTDLYHKRAGERRAHLRVPNALKKIDAAGVLFFLGILLAVSALEVAGLLEQLAKGLGHILPSQNWVAVFLGLLSSIVDNIPLVAATMGMYPASQFPMDASLWQIIAYAAGTGGSILIIGSAAGVAFMGIENVDFIWYFKRISWIALISYFVGLGVYFLLAAL